MQVQPRTDGPGGGGAEQSRQARRISDDAFRGGAMPKQRLELTAPWKVGTSRLWETRKSGVSEE